MTLADLRVNEKAKIVSINIASQKFKDKLANMGIVAGTEITLVTDNKSKDIVMFFANNIEFALRTKQAKNIEVKK